MIPDSHCAVAAYGRNGRCCCAIDSDICIFADSRISVTVPIAVINTIGRSVAGDIDCQIISHGRTAFMGGIIADGTEAEGIYISLSIYCDC